MHKHQCNVILLEEIHSTSNHQLPIAGFDTISHIHHQQHALATYVQTDINCVVISISASNSIIKWQAVLVSEVTIANVYKPPPGCDWLTPPTPLFTGPTIHSGDFNSDHTDWGNAMKDYNALCLAQWALTLTSHACPTRKIRRHFTQLAGTPALTPTRPSLLMMWMTQLQSSLLVSHTASTDQN